MEIKCDPPFGLMKIPKCVFVVEDGSGSLNWRGLCGERVTMVVYRPLNASGKLEPKYHAMHVTQCDGTAFPTVRRRRKGPHPKSLDDVEESDVVARGALGKVRRALI